MISYSCESLIAFNDLFQESLSAAEEGLISGDLKQKWQIKYGADRDDAKTLEKEAKLAAKEGNPTKAINLMNQAIAKYKGLKAIANRIPNKNTFAGTKFSNGSTTYKGLAKTSTLNWCNSKISNCQSYILKWQNELRR